MSRPNPCIKDENGNDVWISRSSVVIPIVFRIDRYTGDVYTLLEKRGEAVSHSGEWCCPCGYIDWDETLEEACQREVKEETGIELNKRNILFFEVGTDVNTKNQSIDHWYMCFTSDEKLDFSSIETKSEVVDLRWLKVANVQKKFRLFSDNEFEIQIYDDDINAGYGTWAFKKHPIKIKQMLKNITKYVRVVNR